MNFSFGNHETHTGQVVMNQFNPGKPENIFSLKEEVQQK